MLEILCDFPLSGDGLPGRFHVRGEAVGLLLQRGCARGGRGGGSGAPLLAAKLPLRGGELLGERFHPEQQLLRAGEL